MELYQFIMITSGENLKNQDWFEEELLLAPEQLVTISINFLTDIDLLIEPKINQKMFLIILE
jgi:hypothetical protein